MNSCSFDGSSVRNFSKAALIRSYTSSEGHALARSGPTLAASRSSITVTARSSASCRRGSLSSSSATLAAILGPWQGVVESSHQQSAMPGEATRK